MHLAPASQSNKNPQARRSFKNEKRNCYEWCTTTTTHYCSFRRRCTTTISLPVYGKTHKRTKSIWLEKRITSNLLPLPLTCREIKTCTSTPCFLFNERIELVLCRRRVARRRPCIEKPLLAHRSAAEERSAVIIMAVAAHCVYVVLIGQSLRTQKKKARARIDTQWKAKS